MCLNVLTLYDVTYIMFLTTENKHTFKNSIKHKRRKNTMYVVIVSGFEVYRGSLTPEQVKKYNNTTGTTVKKA